MLHSNWELRRSTPQKILESRGVICPTRNFCYRIHMLCKQKQLHTEAKFCILILHFSKRSRFNSWRILTTALIHKLQEIALWTVFYLQHLSFCTFFGGSLSPWKGKFSYGKSLGSSERPLFSAFGLFSASPTREPNQFGHQEQIKPTVNCKT